MHVETYFLSRETALEFAKSGKGKRLFEKPHSTAPAIFFPIETAAKVIPIAFQDGSAKDAKAGGSSIIINKLKNHTSPPKVNPAGSSASHNTREEKEAIVKFLMHKILDSAHSEFQAWQNSGASRPIPESFLDLGSNPRVIHMIEPSTRHLGIEDMGASSDYQSGWISSNISNPNGQHSQEAYLRLRDAANWAAQESLKSPRFSSPGKSFLKESSGANLFNEQDATEPKERLPKESIESFESFSGSQMDDFAFYFNELTLRTSVTLCRDQVHSMRLSASSNASISQDPEDIWIQENRRSIQEVVTQLASSCAKAELDCPVILPQNHSLAFAQELRRDVDLVSIHDAAHWLSLNKYAERRGEGKAAGDSSAPAKRDQATKALIAQGFSKSDTNEIVRSIFQMQQDYRFIFAATRGEKKAIYQQLEEWVFPSAKWRRLLEEKRNAAINETFHGDVDLEDIRTLCKEVKTVIEDAKNANVLTAKHHQRALRRLTEVNEDLSEESASAAASAEALAEAIKEISGQLKDNLDPSLLHGAALCCQALNEFKAEEAKKWHAAKGDVTPRSKSELVSDFNKKILGETAFWTKQQSFDRLVGVGVFLDEGDDFIVPRDYQLENSAHRAALTQKLKRSATVAFEKIKHLSAIPDHAAESTISHEFRHTRATVNLATNDPKIHPLLRKFLTQQAGVPKHLANFYEWFMKPKWTALAPKNKTEQDQRLQDKAWVTPKPPKPASVESGAKETAKPKRKP